MAFSQPGSIESGRVTTFCGPPAEGIVIITIPSESTPWAISFTRWLARDALHRHRPRRRQRHHGGWRDVGTGAPDRRQDFGRHPFPEPLGLGLPAGEDQAVEAAFVDDGRHRTNGA